MIGTAISGLAGAWIARQVEDGAIPEKLAAPLTLIAARLPTPVLIAGAIGYGLYRLTLEERALRAKDVTPSHSPRSAKQPKKRSASRRRHKQRKNSQI